MTSFGITNQGFNLKTTSDILDQIEDEQLSTISPALDLNASGPIGQINGIFTGGISELWQVALGIYNSLDPSTAEGDALDLVCRLVGVSRLNATYSTVTLKLNLDGGITIPQDSVVSDSIDSDRRWVTLEEVVSTTAGDYYVDARSEETGPQEGLAGNITVIETAITGWNSVTNEQAALLGRTLETDTELRLRRNEVLAAQGAGTIDSIKSALRNLDGVISVNILENTGSTTDVNGTPGHSFQSVIYESGASSSAIAQALWNNKPAGVLAYGGTILTAYDSDGVARSVGYTAVSQTIITISVDISIDIASFPANGDDLIKEALVEYFNSLSPGEDVVYNKVFAPIYTVSGVDKVDALTLNGGTSDISINIFNVASTNAGVITINHV